MGPLTQDEGSSGRQDRETKRREGEVRKNAATKPYTNPLHVRGAFEHSALPAATDDYREGEWLVAFSTCYFAVTYVVLQIASQLRRPAHYR